MKRVIFAGIVAGALSICGARLEAQFVIHQVQYSIPVSYDLLPDNVELTSPQAEAEYFLQMPDERLLQGNPPASREETVVYTDGKRLTVDTRSPEEGHVTSIIDLQTGKGLFIFWDQQQIFESDREELQAMKKEAEATAEKMLAQLPPEAREQARKAMEQMRTQKPAKPRVTPTGKKATKYGMACEQYLVQQKDGKVSLLWAAADRIGVVKIANAMDEQLAMIMGGEAQAKEGDEWDWVPGKIPVEARTFVAGGPMEGPVIRVRAITAIEKRMPAAEKFQVPAAAQKFPRHPFRDLIMQSQERD